jgi:hypothetical protein
MKSSLLVLLVCCCPLFAQDNVAVALRGVDVLRENLKDPDSLVVEHIYINTKSDKPQMCIRYRAKNSYGGYGREIVKYKGGNLLAADFLSSCVHVEDSWNWATKKGWIEITDDYMKAAAASKP